jgi:hypothetical protein
MISRWENLVHRRFGSARGSLRDRVSCSLEAAFGGTLVIALGIVPTLTAV